MIKIHIEDIICYLNQSFGKKGLKLLLTGCFFIFLILVVFVIAAVIFVFNYQSEIYAVLAKIFSFIFNGSLDNLFKNLVKLISDSLLKQ